VNKQLLQMKLRPPVITDLFVSRRLLQEISSGLEGKEGFNRKLTLLSAPAGFGKTSLLINYYQQVECEACWLTFSDEDNSLDSFLAYLLAALRRVNSNFGREVESSLADGFLKDFSGLTGEEQEKRREKAGREILTAFLNEFSRYKKPFYIFWDELQELQSKKIHDLLSYFIANLPPTVHLIAAGRELPPWPVHRWLARGSSKIIGQDKLKFRPKEAQLFFEQKNKEITEKEAAEMVSRMEGWVTGLQMFSLLGEDFSPRRILESAPNRENFMIDYLLEEVLAEQDQDIQNFLLQTAAVSRFNIELCSDITGYEDCASLLQEIQSRQLFLQPVDEKGDWFRYHRLFAEALQRKFQKENPELKKKINQQAAAWFAERNYYALAVQQALRGENYQFAAQLIFQKSDYFTARGKLIVMQEWLKEIPEEIRREKPELRIVRAKIELYQGNVPLANKMLQQLDEELKAGKLEHMTEDNLKLFTGMLAAGFVVISAFSKRKLTIPIEERLDTALKFLPAGSYWRQGVSLIHGDIQGLSGNLTAALESYRSVRMTSYGEDYYDFFVQVAGIKEARLYWLKGEIEKSQSVCQELLKKAKRSGFAKSPRAGAVRGLLGQIYCEKNELSRAERILNRGEEIVKNSNEILVKLYFNICLLRYYFTVKNFARAEEIFSEIATLPKDETHDILISNITSWQIRFWLEPDYPGSHSWQEALEKLKIRGVEPEREPEFGRLLDFIVLSRVLLSANQKEAAEKVIERTLKIAQQRGLIRAELESRLVEVKLSNSKQNFAEARENLKAILDIANSKGFFRIIVDEGDTLVHLLYRILPDETRGEMIQRLLQEFGETAKEAIQAEDYLIEPLTGRERDILEEIAAGYSNKEIAERLHISHGTVRWHSSNIYNKLGVANRTQAVEKGRKLGILPD